MGTKFRTMLAPIDASTGDGRRFAVDAITLASLPFPFEWARTREGGHDGAVAVGAVQEATIATIDEAVKAEWVSPEAAKALGLDGKSSAVWARGELFDDVDRETMPRLAEDVAEAMHLIREGTLGPSVDLDSFEAVPVIEGTDTPVSWEDIEDYYDEHGEEPALELLVTEGRVRAATLVTIPAFAETSRPMELIEPDETEASADVVTAASEDPDTIGEANREHVAALVASVATLSGPTAALFDRPALAGPTPITWDFDNGIVFGHIATWRTCHVGYSDVCVTPPRDTADYASFNRFPVETADGGVVWAGRLTVGGLHAPLAAGASQAMSAYDDKTVAAHVRAYEDEFGIVVAGVIEPGLDDRTKRVLSRRKVSGDWRETHQGMSLIELLALSPGPRQHSEPGFPVATHSRFGRQVSLTAAFGVPVDQGAVTVQLSDRDIDLAIERREARRLARLALAEIVQRHDEEIRAEARTSLAALVSQGAV